MTADIRSVLFDLDDTLLDGDAAWRSGLDRLITRCPQVAPEAAFLAWDAAFREHYPRYLAGQLTLAESQAARIRSWAAQLAVTVAPGSELAWFSDFLGGYEAGWAAFGDVAPCLSALAGLRLGVITNGDSSLQRAKLAAIGLADRFDVVVASGDVGWAKPDARIFRRTADLLGIPPDQCLYVGDQRDSDAMGARAAGMQAAWLNRRAVVAPDDLIPEITTLATLTSLVTSSCRGR